jgi:hypothetical protein
MVKAGTGLPHAAKRIFYLFPLAARMEGLVFRSIALFCAGLSEFFATQP